MNGRFIGFLMAVGVCLSAADAGADWTIQVGAFANDVSVEFLESADAHGSAYEQHRSDGSIAVNIGPWGSREAAEHQLDAIREDFPGAFIKRFRGAGNSDRTILQSDEDDQTGLLDQVPANQRHNVVILDGRLHYKAGNEFTPLSEYLRGR